MRAAAQSSPNTSPTQPETLRNAEIEEYSRKVFCRVYYPHEDDDFENMSDSDINDNDMFIEELE
jgi:hypothetical protein